ncbi:MAG: methyltransferase [Candidatus Aminicenantes bacterium RBG_13_64_14]|nr:MAG: methyltransferase [Candidatus Aminicenantes bacterium RBG_13_64_14]
MSRKFISALLFLVGALCFFAAGTVVAKAAARAEPVQNPGLDENVRDFLEKHRRSWRDMNVPEADGQILYDLIIQNGYTRALEIGTSTGHSGVWIAWALSKTGGRLVTIEIDAGRHREAAANFREAGLAAFIDARLADAHEVVPALKGPFDFVFIDADKDWYVNYARAVIPKLEAGGCLAAHNVHAARPGGRGWRRDGMGTADYYEFMTARPDFETSIHPDSWSGLALSYKKR